MKNGTHENSYQFSRFKCNVKIMYIICIFGDRGRVILTSRRGWCITFFGGDIPQNIKSMEICSSNICDTLHIPRYFMILPRHCATLVLWNGSSLVCEYVLLWASSFFEPRVTLAKYAAYLYRKYINLFVKKGFSN